MSNTTGRLTQDELYQHFVADLGQSCLESLGGRPLLLDLKPPLPSRVRIYIWNLTRPPGGRPADELKIQFIIPGQARGARASFDESGGRSALVIGYSQEDEVYVFWDAGCYPHFAYSRNVQVKSDTIITAFAGQVATQRRSLRLGGMSTIETVVAVPAKLVSDGILLRDKLTRDRLLALA